MRRAPDPAAECTCTTLLLAGLIAVRAENTLLRGWAGRLTQKEVGEVEEVEMETDVEVEAVEDWKCLRYLVVDSSAYEVSELEVGSAEGEKVRRRSRSIISFADEGLGSQEV